MFLKRSLNVALTNASRNITTSPVLEHVQFMTRCNLIDNSKIAEEARLVGKRPKCIHVYNKSGLAGPGDRILVAILGAKKKAVVVGTRQKQRPMNPKFDCNNIVLVDDNDAPLGTKILAPIPGLTLHRVTAKRGDRRGSVDCTKILAIASRLI